MLPLSVEWPEKSKYWRVENLQTMGLVCGCAYVKTAKEASARAKVIRIQKRIMGLEKPKKKIPARVRPKKVKRERPPVVSYLHLK